MSHWTLLFIGCAVLALGGFAYRAAGWAVAAPVLVVALGFLIWSRWRAPHYASGVGVGDGGDGGGDGGGGDGGGGN